MRRRPAKSQVAAEARTQAVTREQRQVSKTARRQRPRRQGQPGLGQVHKTAPPRSGNARAAKVNLAWDRYTRPRRPPATPAPPRSTCPGTGTQDRAAPPATPAPPRSTWPGTGTQDRAARRQRPRRQGQPGLGQVHKTAPPAGNARAAKVNLSWDRYTRPRRPAGNARAAKVNLAWDRYTRPRRPAGNARAAKVNLAWDRYTRPRRPAGNARAAKVNLAWDRYTRPRRPPATPAPPRSTWPGTGKQHPAKRCASLPGPTRHQPPGPSGYVDLGGAGSATAPPPIMRSGNIAAKWMKRSDFEGKELSRDTSRAGARRVQHYASSGFHPRQRG